MTLREMLNKTSYKEVFNRLYRNHYKKKPESEVHNYALEYNKVFNTLINLKFTGENKYKIYITEKEEIGLGDDEPVKFTDVCLYDEKDDKLYSIDLIPWAELIDLEILDCLNLDNYDLLAEILWEITFYGFNELDIRDESRKMREACAETGEAISIDDLFKLLDSYK